MATTLINSRALIQVSGPDAAHFLNNLVTTDLSGMTVREWRSGAILTAQGKVQFTFLIAREHESFLIETEIADSAEFHKRIKFYRLRAKVDFTDPVERPVCVTWDGPSPPASRRDVRFGSYPVWRNFLVDSDNAGDLADWTRLRIVHGVAEPHADYAYNDVFPHDINLDQIGGVSFKKGCYVGQEVVSRMQHRGTARWRLMVAKADTKLTGAVELFANAKPVGRIGSVSGMYGLALVRLDRIREALDANVPILAGQLPVRFEFPQNVTYGWPQPAKAV
ncbi:MAG: folate-binding protein [Rhizobiaceae bacterium]